MLSDLNHCYSSGPDGWAVVILAMNNAWIQLLNARLKLCIIIQLYACCMLIANK